jgi:aspartyl-tRNA(Asn)/glutamyl-tRNA(Gln) amidotransferase subunit B
MFCGCKNSPDEGESNAYICPICLGNPGTLPVINKEAVKKVLMVGTALGGKIADFTEFDRKNYFYPDIPKGYQISQYKYPLVSGGSLAGVDITRIHLEEDTAKSTHDTPGVSLVDFNRAGVPLMELVTEPVIHSSEQAMNFAKELQLLLQYLGVSDANMEKGEMRVEVNISISKNEKFGTKVEVKNINSFRAAGKAIDFELARQSELLERGEKVVQETRGWDENKEITFSQRSKENANDYRYFPDPDLPKLVISEIPEFGLDELKKDLPELPNDKRLRYEKDFGIKSSDIETYINNIEAGLFLEKLGVELADSGNESIKLASNYIISDIVGLSKAGGSEFNLGFVTVENFSQLIKMIINGDLSSRGAKDTLKIMYEIGGEPSVIAKEKGYIQKNDPEEVKRVMQEIIDNNQDSVLQYKNGKDSLLQFFVGQGMKAMKGSGNPELIKSIVLELLK